MIREWLELGQYRRQFRVALLAKRASGEVSAEDFRALWAGTKKTKFLRNLRYQTESIAKRAGAFSDDFKVWAKRLADWFIENWPTILRVSLTLLMMLL